MYKWEGGVTHRVPEDRSMPGIILLSSGKFKYYIPRYTILYLLSIPVHYSEQCLKTIFVHSDLVISMFSPIVCTDIDSDQDAQFQFWYIYIF